MEFRKASLLLFALLIGFLTILTEAKYSAKEDERIIAAFRQRLRPPHNHAKVARQLVHNVNWASIGTISTDDKLHGFPMVNLISISDSAEGGPSTGKVFFLMTDLDFTGKDIKNHNNVTLLFSQEQRGNCSEIDVDPMEPLCWRAIISGSVQVLDKNAKDYEFGVKAFMSRHPAAANWIKRHHFYLFFLAIEHIYVLDFYGGAKEVSVKDYYSAKLDGEDSMELFEYNLVDDFKDL